MGRGCSHLATPSRANGQAALGDWRLAGGRRRRARSTTPLGILICYQTAGAGKPDTRGYPPGTGGGKGFRPWAASRAGKGWQHGYARERVNGLPARTRPAAIPSHEQGCGDAARARGSTVFVTSATGHSSGARRGRQHQFQHQAGGALLHRAPGPNH
jgi:hypothetical protein